MHLCHLSPQLLPVNLQQGQSCTLGHPLRSLLFCGAGSYNVLRGFSLLSRHFTTSGPLWSQAPVHSSLLTRGSQPTMAAVLPLTLSQDPHRDCFGILPLVSCLYSPLLVRDCLISLCVPPQPLSFPLGGSPCPPCLCRLLWSPATNRYHLGALLAAGSLPQAALQDLTVPSSLRCQAPVYSSPMPQGSSTHSDCCYASGIALGVKLGLLEEPPMLLYSVLNTACQVMSALLACASTASRLCLRRLTLPLCLLTAGLSQSPVALWN